MACLQTTSDIKKRPFHLHNLAAN